MADQERDDDDDDLGRMSLGTRILVVVSFAWLLLAYQIINPGVRAQFPWEDYFVIGPAPVLIVVALYGIWTVLKRR